MFLKDSNVQNVSALQFWFRLLKLIIKDVVTEIT